jgi:preprotein translocase subunit SecF
MAKRIFAITKYRFHAVILSAVLLLAGIAGYVAFGGFNLGIDFQSGFSQRVKIESSTLVSIDTMRDALGADIQVQVVGESSDQTFKIRMGADNATEEELADLVLGKLTTAFGQDKVVVQQSDFVGPKYSATLIAGSILIVVVSIGLILLYIWFRFKISYALAAIIGLVHDTLMLLGFIAVFQLEVSSTTIAAILTIIGYSLNNVIVIFDRIRENRPILKDLSMMKLVDTSVSQSLTRTLFSSLTTILAIVPLALLASGAIQLFAIEMVFGILVGAYSCNFLAPSFLLWITKKKVETHPKHVTGATATDATQINAGTTESAVAEELAIPTAERKLKGKRQQNK